MMTLNIQSKVRSILFSILLLSGNTSLFISFAHANNTSCGTYTEANPLHPNLVRQRANACLQAPIDFNNQASLQRGAALYMNNCVSCHSLKYLRYGRMAKDLSLSPALLEQYMRLTNGKVSDSIDSKIDPLLQKKIFGAVPPDLTLETRVHSPDWVYTYLLSFYPDKSRP
jgi:ubiquinol-cytochrome c reductase cytochrome c1 subunit